MDDFRKIEFSFTPENKQYLITLTNDGVALVSQFYVLSTKAESTFLLTQNRIVVEGEIGSSKLVQIERECDISEEDIAKLVME